VWADVIATFILAATVNSPAAMLAPTVILAIGVAVVTRRAK
jgi:hypothetical protein